MDDGLAIKLKTAKDPTCREKSTKFGRCRDCRVASNVNGARKGSRAAKHEAAETKRKNGVKMQIKRAEKNLKSFYTVLNKVTKKPDEDVVIPEIPNSRVS